MKLCNDFILRYYYVSRVIKLVFVIVETYGIILLNDSFCLYSFFF